MQKLELIDRTPEEFLTGELDISEAMQFLMDIGAATDYADDFGEPGYRLDNPEGFFVIGNWWCYGNRHDDCPTREDGSPDLHSVSDHYAKLFERLGEAGMECAFYDEWLIVNGVQVGEYPNIETKSLAYRTTGDSWGWQPAYLDAGGDILTKEDGIEAWVEYLLENEKGLQSRIWNEADIEGIGFTEYQCDFEQGWFAGMNDDPDAIYKKMKEEFGKTHDILMFMKEVSQFYFRFCVFIREKKDEE